MSKKEISLYGQSFKSLREEYGMSYKMFMANIEAIRPKLDKICGRSRYNDLLPKQVELIIKHLEGEK
jgi:hypothetical protein